MLVMLSRQPLRYVEKEATKLRVASCTNQYIAEVSQPPSHSLTKLIEAAIFLRYP